MNDRHDQTELLAFVEGELSPQQVSALRKRFAGEPKLLTALDAMRADRAALRMLSETELPRDFALDLQPMIARQMLIQPLPSDESVAAKPGEFRRQYRRQHRRIRWSRLAVAAVVLLVLMAGIWAATNGLIQFRPRDNSLASSDLQDQPIGNLQVGTVQPLEGTIHHHMLPGAPQRVLATRMSAPRVDTNSQPGQNTFTVAADFMVIVRAADSDAAVDAIAGLISENSQIQSAALVRNFSYDEAQRIARDWRIADGRRTDRIEGAPAVVDASPSRSRRVPREIESLARHVREQLKLPSADSQDQRSGLLAGEQAIAPGLEQQLDFSSRGATHTIAVSVCDLPRVLEQLSSVTGRSTVLRTLSSESPVVSADRSVALSPLNQWLEHAKSVRQSIARLQEQTPEAIVVVPMVIDTSK